LSKYGKNKIKYKFKNKSNNKKIRKIRYLSNSYKNYIKLSTIFFEFKKNNKNNFL